jgi:cyanophycin synthetase
MLTVRALEGPNIWAQVSVLEALVDLSAWQQLAPASLAAIRELLDSRLPGLAGRRAPSSPSQDAPGDPIGAALAGTLRDVALELYTLARTPVGTGRTEATESPHVYWVVVQYEEEALGRACLDCARRFCEAAITGADFDTPAESERLYRLGMDLCLDDHTGPVLAAARARGIPFRRLDQKSLVQLGWGARQKRIQKAFTSQTGKIAEWISLDKDVTKRLLQELGIPVPGGRAAANADDAWTAACELGLPVAVKPRDADYGAGVSLNLSTREEIRTAYASAREVRDEVLVERYVNGHHCRVTVIDGQVVAADLRIPPTLVGDGEHSIRQLMDLANLDPRRSHHRLAPLSPISLDIDAEQVLTEQGFTLDTVVPAGVDVTLSRVGHICAGAGGRDVTDSVHPSVAAQCISAVRVVGLDVAGIDLIAEDISQPLEAQGGVILEVNAEPALFLHFPPFSDTYRPVCERIIESLFPIGQLGRIPVAGVTGDGDNLAVCRWLGYLLQSAGQRIGVASSQGLHLNERRLKQGDQTSLAGGRALFLSPEVDVAVLQRSLVSIRQEGLGFNLCDVAVITRLRDDVERELLQAARVLVEAVGPNGTVVIDADDPAAAALVGSSASRAIRVSSSSARHLTAGDQGPGRRAVQLLDNQLVLSSADGPEQAITIDRRLAAVVAAETRASPLLAAVAAAWAMNVPIDAIEGRLGQLERNMTSV